ncbi:hypothetical protein HYU90_02630 [Candidatus Collierbacteria bacterium]|nr:hypothetical protein [Candidatus Collierbacteria bacterium]
MNQLGSTSKTSSSTKSTFPKVNNFLETLKNNQASPMGNRFESPFGANPFAEFNRQKEVEKQRVAQFHQARLKEWEQVYSAKDKQIEKQIEEIRQELQALAKQIVKYDQNVTGAIQAQVVTPGIYHVSFFEHIKQIIALIRKNVTEANSWLSVFKKRSAQKGGAFWENTKKGGTSYMMSGEHSASRSAG